MNTNKMNNNSSAISAPVQETNFLKLSTDAIEAISRLHDPDSVECMLESIDNVIFYLVEDSREYLPSQTDIQAMILDHIRSLASIKDIIKDLSKVNLFKVK